MLTLKPFISRTLRRLGFDTEYKRHAAKSWEFEPACISERFAALFDEDDLQKVKSTAQHTTLQYQVELLRAGKYQHPARRVYVLHDVLMVGGHFFKLRMVHAMAHRPLSGISFLSPREVSSAALGTSEYGNKYFGHWYCDDVPLSQTARQFGDVYGHANSDNRLIGHQKRYAEMFDWKINLVENALFKELMILDWSPMTPRQNERFMQLRRCLPSVAGASANAGVMLLRQTSGQQRVLDNEVEIADMVRRRGFKVIDPMNSSADELVAACAGARVLMGVEGSQLTHGFLPLMAPGGTLLTLQPPFKFDHFWKARCDCVGARYAFIVGEQTTQAGFNIEVDKVQRMLDRIEKI